MRISVLTGIIGAALLAAAVPAGAQVFSDAQLAGAVNKSLPLLHRSSTGFQKVMGKVCYSCHNQSIQAVSFAVASARGLKVDNGLRTAQRDYVYGYVAPYGEQLHKASGAEKAALEQKVDKAFVEPTLTAGYALFALAEEGVAPNPSLAAMAQYIASKQMPDGRWPVFAARPPMEGSEFTTTALALRALQTYGDTEALAAQVVKGRTWLLEHQPKSTEDKTFRLFGLGWSDAPAAAVSAAVKDLLADQRDDGGWSQLPGKASDAYATGQALVALHRAGRLAVSDSAYARGIGFLLMRQQTDGSWYVPTRVVPVQQYFETGFPYGKSQFISAAGSAWATAALALALPERNRTASK